MATDSPDVVIGKRLLDLARRHGFQFQRLAPGPEGPLWGVRDTERWHDTIYLGGFSRDCSATRSRKSPLLVPSDLLVTDQVSGDALNVLNTVVGVLTGLTGDTPTRWSGRGLGAR